MSASCAISLLTHSPPHRIQAQIKIALVDYKPPAVGKLPIRQDQVFAFLLHVWHISEGAPDPASYIRNGA
jgi:hypothetical protein